MSADHKNDYTAMPSETYAVISEIIQFIDDEDQKRGNEKRRPKNQP
jgi:type III secretion system FlhB-like substrate exporter